MKEIDEKKYRILHELGEGAEEGLIKTMENLDDYQVAPPTTKSTEDLIVFLKPLLQQSLQDKLVMNHDTHEHRLLTALQLVQPQSMLLSKRFIALTVLCMVFGLIITNAFDGNTMKFLTNTAPILGVLTVFYEFRAKLSGVNELEAACPYSQAQLATARLIVVLSYTVLLCLLVTPLVSYWQGQVLWIVIIRWFAPLLLMLGIALSASIKLGIVGGCLIATTVWAVQFIISKSGMEFSYLLQKQPTMLIELISLVIGIGLIFYSYKRWHFDTMVLRSDKK